MLGGAWGAKELTAAAFFTGFGILAEVLQYQRAKGSPGTIGFLPFLSIALISPNGAAVASVFFAMLIGEIIMRRELLKAQFNISQQVLAVTVGIIAYKGLGGQALLLDGSALFLPSAALFVVYMVTNKAVVALVLALANRTSFASELARGFKGALLNDVLALPLVLVIALAYERFGPVWTGILAFPMLGVRQLYKTVFELERINEELLQLMVAAIEARDPYTSGHSQRVARYSRVIARLTGLSARKVDQIGTAALLHDVGKIHEEFAPILRKPGRLTDPEFEVMKTHSAKSAALVGKVTQFAELVPMVRGHHERWSGRGYPDSLAGDAIPLGARVITIADTLDAMTTVRPYRPPRSLDEVREEIARVAGNQFDPRLCAVLLTDEKWAELCLEVEIASREYPADGSHVDPENAPATQRSMQLRAP
ncbi:MAG: hypothetical protein C0497_13790 [Gemmatimonas sp.]|nr:hypothetical protein [Gemmatimonas sp.]